MQVATVIPESMVGADAEVVDRDRTRIWVRRAAIALFIVIGLSATAVILIKMGAFAVYGLPAPFIRRAA